MRGSVGVTGRGLDIVVQLPRIQKYFKMTLNEAQGAVQGATSLNHPICPRADASPPEAHEEIALYICGRYLEW